MSQEAIKAVGFTDDGMVGMLINLDISGQKFEANIAMDPDYTEQLAEGLKSAAAGAREKQNERNSTNPDKSKSESNKRDSHG